jgi:hypothetical protein
MSLDDHQSTLNNNAHSISRKLPLTMNGKASAAAPKLSDAEDNVEMRSMMAFDGESQPERDIMQLSRLGDIAGVQKLF